MGNICFDSDKYAKKSTIKEPPRSSANRYDSPVKSVDDSISMGSDGLRDSRDSAYSNISYDNWTKIECVNKHELSIDKFTFITSSDVVTKVTSFT